MKDVLNLPLRIDDDGDLVDEAGFVPELPEEREEIMRRVNVHGELLSILKYIHNRVPLPHSVYLAATQAIDKAEGRNP